MKHIQKFNNGAVPELVSIRFNLNDVVLYSTISRRGYVCEGALWKVQVCLLADVIQHFVDQKLDFDCAYVYEDVQKCIENVHRSGSLHKAILKDPQKFLQKNVCILHCNPHRFIETK